MFLLYSVFSKQIHGKFVPVSNVSLDKIAFLCKSGYLLCSVLISINSTCFIEFQILNLYNPERTESECPILLRLKSQWLEMFQL